MAYVITQSCCNDATCILECPVDCIRPTPGDPGFVSAEMLYIDPDSCIDCGACQDACPVSAVYPEDELPPHLRHFAASGRRVHYERGRFTTRYSSAWLLVSKRDATAAASPSVAKPSA